ncbi:MAG: hypothetical protein AAGB26_00645 [Planctomycetota bacterium]
MIRATAITLTSALAVATSASAGWTHEIDLDQYEHGTVLNGVDLGPFTGSADNFHSTTDLLVAFDTTQTGTRDRDLEGPNSGGGSWKDGNLAGTNADVGTILIIQEINSSFAGYTDSSQTMVSRPDDEGRRSGGSQPGAGEITLEFHNGVNAFGFTLIDVEKTGEFNNETGFFALFSDGNQTTKVSFADLIDEDSVYYDPSIEFGDNSANRIEALTAAELGLEQIERVTINLGGSGGVGEFTVTGVPSPNAMLGGLGLMAMLVARRNSRKRC